MHERWHRLPAKAEKSHKTVLITGAGTGFGNEAAMRRAEKGFNVIAAVEIDPQFEILANQERKGGVTLKIEKLDVTNEGDSRKVSPGTVKILGDNAGILEGGAVTDIPGANMRLEFGVNAIGPLVLTQDISKQMIKHSEGNPVSASSAMLRDGARAARLLG